MFSTLLGALPPLPDPVAAGATGAASVADTDHAASAAGADHAAIAAGTMAVGAIADGVADGIADLEAVGLELLSTGMAPAGGARLDPARVVDAWRAVAGATQRPVKQVLAGPYSAGRRGSRSAPIALAEALQPVIAALVTAGCPLIEIDEPDALPIAVDARERDRFGHAHRRLLDGVDDVHVSLALTGGNLDTAGAATFFDLPYASYAFDLIAGPDNWRLIAATPADRGVICGALDPDANGDETRELLVWAAHYAASTAGRGGDRVGLANASSLAGLTRGVALRKLRVVAEATRIAAVESPNEMAALLDPRAFGRRRERPGATPDRGPESMPPPGADRG